MSERYAPSSAIRERARLIHPAKPEPTVDDVLWYLDEQAKVFVKFSKSVADAFRQVGKALRGGRRQRAAPTADPPKATVGDLVEAGPHIPPCDCCGKPCNLDRANLIGVLRCDWCMGHCRMATGEHKPESPP